MRFAILCQAIADRTADFFHTLAEVLTERGHEVTLIRWSVKPGRSIPVPQGAKELVFPSKKPTHLKDYLFLYQVLSRGKYDCLLANWAGVKTGSICGFVSRVPLRCCWFHEKSDSMLISLGGKTLKAQYLLARRRLMYRLYTHVIAVSDACREDLRKFWRIPEERIVVVRNSIRRPSASVMEAKPEPGKIVCAARLHPVKGHDWLFRALEIIKGQFPEICCHLLGDGPERERLMGVVGSMGLSGVVIFRGHVDQDTVLREMRSSTLTVMPSLDEAFPFAALESIAVGTPVVATGVGGLPEIIRNGREGFLVEPRNERKLGAAIATILRDGTLREEMSRNAVERFDACFELTKQVSIFVDWLEENIRVGKQQRVGFRNGFEN